MAVVRDRKTLKVLGPPDPITINFLGQKMDVSKGAARWETRGKEDVLAFRSNGLELGHFWIKPSDSFRVFTYADSQNNLGKIFSVDLKVKGDK